MIFKCDTSIPEIESVFDFVECVHLNAWNRKNGESLALSGAFDSFSDVSREQFLSINKRGEQFTDILWRFGNKVQADRKNATNSLFGDFGGVDISKPEILKVEPWSALEKLNKERELVGIYLSATPLDEYSTILNHVCNAEMCYFANLDNLKKKVMSAGGWLTILDQGISKTDHS